MGRVMLTIGRTPRRIGHLSLQHAQTIALWPAIDLPKAVVSACLAMHCTKVMMMEAIYSGERMAGRLR